MHKVFNQSESRKVFFKIDFFKSFFDASDVDLGQGRVLVLTNEAVLRTLIAWVSVVFLSVDTRVGSRHGSFCVDLFTVDDVRAICLGLLKLFLGSVFHESEAPRAVCVRVSHDDYIDDFTWSKMGRIINSAIMFCWCYILHFLKYNIPSRFIMSICIHQRYNINWNNFSRIIIKNVYI